MKFQRHKLISVVIFLFIIPFSISFSLFGQTNKPDAGAKSPFLTEKRDKPTETGIDESYMPVMVRLDGIWFGKYEISFREYNYYHTLTEGKSWSDVLLERYQRRYKAKYVEIMNLVDLMPVTSVKWQNAKQYAQWLSRVTGKKYRLPSKSEWEHAAYGGKEKSGLVWEKDMLQLCKYANIADQTAFNEHPAITKDRAVQCDDGYSHVSPCGSYLPNGFQIHDMIGNAYEWVRSSKGYILKGGSYLDSGKHLQISQDRKYQNQNQLLKQIGFRVVRED